MSLIIVVGGDTDDRHAIISAPTKYYLPQVSHRTCQLLRRVYPIHYL